MAEPIVEPNANGEPVVTPPAAKTYTEEERNAAAAAARRESEAKLAENQKRLDELEAKEKERQDLELSELEKSQNQVSELTGQVEEYKVYKEKLSEYELVEAEKINKTMADGELTEEQIARVNKLPLPDRSEMANDLIAFKTVTPPGGAGKYLGGPGDPTKEQILAMPDGQAKSNAWRKFRDAGGV